MLQQRAPICGAYSTGVRAFPNTHTAVAACRPNRNHLNARSMAAAPRAWGSRCNGGSSMHKPHSSPVHVRASASESSAEYDKVEEQEAAPEAEPKPRTSSMRREHKHFLPLPKPEHLVYIKPFVAVVAGVASSKSVGLHMTAGGQQLERYVIEYYSRKVK